MNHRETQDQRNRLRFLAIGLALIVAVMGFKLIYIQIVMHDHYLAQAISKQTRKYEIPSHRGQLYAMDGETVVPLALNQTLKVIYADPRFVKDKPLTAKKLAAILGGKSEDYIKELGRGGQYVELATRVPSDQAAAVRKLALPGIGMINRDYRTYPEGSLAAQVLGFVNANGDGQYGIEGYLNQKLKGKPGLLSAKTDTKGIPIGTANNRPLQEPVDGVSYALTIDRNVQAEVERQLEAQVKAVRAKSGSVLIMDPNTGAVKAMANYPTFDPNEYSKVKDYEVFSNRTVSSQFEPGSTVKVFTVAAGIDTGKITPDTKFDDPGFYKIGNWRIGNAIGDKAGPNKTMTVALKDSLNTGMMFILRRMSGEETKFSLSGKQTLYDYFTDHFSLGVRTGIEQAGEVAGQVHTPANGTSSDVKYANMTFGQGMSSTMVQLVTAMSAIANGGKLYQPHLIGGTVDSVGTVTPIEPKLLRAGVVAPDTAKQLNEMMKVAVRNGTGYRAALENPGYQLAGKTGTAQIPRPDGKGYLEGVNIGSFLGYAPANDPKFVMLVRIDEPHGAKFAETTTVPLFSSLSTWLFKYYGIPPS